MIDFKRIPLRFALLWSALVSPASALAADWQVSKVDTRGPVDLVTIDEAGETVVIAGGQPQIVVVEGARVFTRPHETWGPPPPLPRDALPDGEAAVSQKAPLAGDEIRAAWYGEPTTRYAHGILGDAIEAGALVVQDGAGREHRLRLPETQVFEDRFPRLADLDGDGRDEVVTIRSDLASGAALAVYRLTDEGLQEVASTPTIGRANRWLNIAAIADVSGDGRLDVALVKTPHIGGTLELWSLRGDRLELVASAPGFSNHAIGARAQRLSAAVDLGDGKTDLVVPSADRRALRLVGFAGGGFEDLGTIRLPAEIASDLGVVAAAGGPAFVYAGSDGRLYLVRRAR